MVSRALIEGKKAFLSEREKILAQVFSDIMNKINDFIANAEEYRPFLINTVKEGISKVGEGEITVLINKTDINYEKDIVDEVKNQLNIGVNVAVESAEIIGGCKVWNKSKNTIADFSIKGRIEKEKGEFLKFSGLILD
jgi:vacuolar-type H+-ATPase subunit E/Vma4